MPTSLLAILATALIIFTRILWFLVVLRVFMSWLPQRSHPGSIARYIISTTEPYLSFFRTLPLRIGMIDLSPLAALLVLDMLRTGILSLLPYLG